MPSIRELIRQFAMVFMLGAGIFLWQTPQEVIAFDCADYHCDGEEACWDLDYYFSSICSCKSVWGEQTDCEAYRGECGITPEDEGRVCIIAVCWGGCLY